MRDKDTLINVPPVYLVGLWTSIQRKLGLFGAACIPLEGYFYWIVEIKILCGCIILYRETGKECALGFICRDVSFYGCCVGILLVQAALRLMNDNEFLEVEMREVGRRCSRVCLEDEGECDWLRISSCRYVNRFVFFFKMRSRIVYFI